MLDDEEGQTVRVGVGGVELEDLLGEVAVEGVLVALVQEFLSVLLYEPLLRRLLRHHLHLRHLQHIIVNILLRPHHHPLLLRGPGRRFSRQVNTLLLLTILIALSPLRLLPLILPLN